MNPEKNPVRWSDEVFRIFGYEPGEIEPSRRAFFRSVHPDEREEVRQSLDYALREARPYAIDFRIIRPDGAERNIHERGDIIFDSKTQKPVKLVGSVQDVTERVQAEIRLHNANQELAEKVQELEQAHEGNQSLERNGKPAPVLQGCGGSLLADQRHGGKAISKMVGRCYASPAHPEQRWRPLPIGAMPLAESASSLRTIAGRCAKASRNRSGAGKRHQLAAISIWRM